MDTRVKDAIEYFEQEHVPVSIEITNICSAKCSFCWYRKGGDWRKPGLISDSVLDRFLDLLEEHAKPGEVVNLSTAHGDVLTNRNLPKIIERITSTRNVGGVPFFTNAILLHKFDIRELLGLKIHHANFSTAIGSEEQYRRLYGRNCYRRTYENILAFLKRNNEARRKVPVRVLLRVDKPFSKIKATDDFKRLEAVIGGHRISFLEAWDDYNGLIRSEDLPRGGHVFKPVRPVAEIPCYALYRKLEVLKDGDIACCTCRLSKDLVVGDVFDAKTFSEVWAGESLRKLRGDWLRGEFPSICGTCSHYQPVTALYKSIRRRQNPILRYYDLLKYRLGSGQIHHE